MNEELQQAVADLLQRAISGMDSATAFLSAELPDYVYQLMLWHGLSSGVKFILSAIVAVLLILTINRCAKREIIGEFNHGGGKRYRETTFIYECGSYKDEMHVVAIFGIAGAITATIVAASNLAWLQILIAPKVWLVEYAAAILK